MSESGEARGPGRFGGSLICLCELSPNKTYCPHTEGICPWWDREPVNPTWHRVEGGEARNHERRLYVRRIVEGPTQRVPLPPRLIGPDGVQVGDLVLVQQTEGNNRARHGSIVERPNLRTNLCTVRYA